MADKFWYVVMVPMVYAFHCLVPILDRGARR